MTAAAAARLPEKPVPDWPVILFLAAVHLGALAAFLPGTFSWPALTGLLFGLGGWPFVVWDIFVRLVVVYNSTWLVNSATHRWGYGSHPTRDRSANCWWVALLTYDEGWHNNHHAFPRSARQGLCWWELDMIWWMVRGL